MDVLLIHIDAFSDDEEDAMLVIRRPYTLRNRPQHLEMWDDIDFFTRFRLTKRSVLILFHRIEDRLQIMWNQQRALSPINRLLLTLRFYATGSFLRTLGDFCGVSICTASRVIRQVSMAIASLRRNSIVMPRNREEIKEMQQKFYSMYRFPRVVGCIDCTHIRMQSPGGENAEVFRNRKGYFSLNTQVVCDPHMKIIDIVARWPGSSHDSIIFIHSRLHQRFEENEFVNALLLGDNGYPTKKYLVTPVLNPATPAEEAYNFAHIRTRNIVERVFGVWKRRFPVLSIGTRVQIETVQDIIVATAVLHNIAIDEKEEEPPEIVHIDNEQLDIEQPPHGLRAADNATREHLINEYFARLQ